MTKRQSQRDRYCHNCTCLEKIWANQDALDEFIANPSSHPEIAEDDFDWIRLESLIALACMASFHPNLGLRKKARAEINHPQFAKLREEIIAKGKWPVEWAQ